MLRRILALLAGLVCWLLVATLVNRALRMGLAGYAAAEPSMAFTLPMLWSRLLMGALSSIVAGMVAARVLPEPAPATGLRGTLLGLLLLLFFLPVHWKLWSSFPVWYHLLFLGTLVPLCMIGARLRPGR